MEQERLITLYTELRGTRPISVERLPGAGSNRIYYRLTADADSLIGVVGTSAEENRAFCTLSAIMVEKGLPVPQVYAHTDDYLCYLQTDLGSVSLFDALRSGRESGGDYSPEQVRLLERTMSQLPSLQFCIDRDEQFDCCYPQREMDRTSVMFDLNYFKYCFLKLRGIEFNEYKLQADLEHLADDLVSDTANTFLYRDFQARNVMLVDGTEPHFIDFQGGRKGPIYYDVASFLWQASARYPEALRSHLIDVYIEALQPYRQTDVTEFKAQLRLFVFFRLLQVLGAYGYRGLWEKKQHFIDSIPPALDNLRSELALGTASPYPYLQEVCLQLIASASPSQSASADSTSKSAAYLASDATYLQKSERPLVVRINSFSFKKGIPQDDSGNGGGYVFDCRSTHNPGRYAEYKPLTGLDQPVIQFLEEDGEILTFLDSVYKIVDFHTQRFIDRGFTDLMISFGCTGGRHRSVYSAQHVAEHLHRKFGVEVRICHREQGINQVLEAK